MYKQDFRELAAGLEAQRWEHLLNADAPALSLCLSDDLIFIHSSGLKDDKEAYLDSIRKMTVLYHRAEREIAAVIALGEDAFLVQGDITMDVTLKEAPRTLNSLYSVIWRREDGRWRLVSHQTTPKPV